MKTPADTNNRLPADLEAHLNADEREELEKVWHVLEQGRPEREFSPDAIEARLRQVRHVMKTRSQASHADRGPRQRSHRRRRRWGVVAVLTVVLVGFAGYWHTPVVVQAPLGERITVTLPDASTVELNSGSTLAYQRHFSRWPGWQQDVRQVRLQGEGFFDVAHEGRPFRVETFNASVEVIGTRFNVRAWEHGVQKKTIVALEEGQVRLLGKEEASVPVMLRAGEVSHVQAAAAPTPPETIAVERVAAWRTRGFAFSDQPFQSVIEELERRYAVEITVSDSAMAQLRMTAFYSNPLTVEAILDDLAANTNLRYRTTPTGYTFYRPVP